MSHRISAYFYCLPSIEAHYNIWVGTLGWSHVGYYGEKDNDDIFKMNPITSIVQIGQLPTDETEEVITEVIINPL